MIGGKRRCKANALKRQNKCLFHSGTRMYKSGRKGFQRIPKLKSRRKKPDYSDMTPMTYRYRGGRRVR